MKKVILLSLLLAASVMPMVAEDLNESEKSVDTQAVQEQINLQKEIPASSKVTKIKSLPPKWTDFCEAGYENAVYKNNHDVFDIFSFVKSERVKRNYWAERRVSFEKYLKTCDSLNETAKDSCYAKLVESENQKNDLYKIKRKELLYENNMDIQRR